MSIYTTRLTCLSANRYCRKITSCYSFTSVWCDLWTPSLSGKDHSYDWFLEKERCSAINCEEFRLIYYYHMFFIITFTCCLLLMLIAPSWSLFWLLLLLLSVWYIIYMYLVEKERYTWAIFINLWQILLW